ncbi:hypothetical protein NST77_17160 [Niallia sp. FSL W8-0177]|uniref:hypothetical protein n=1 Tax=Niallia sp. FSL W8-0177 TaxID=2954522 RepID=UPI0030FCDAB6
MHKSREDISQTPGVISQTQILSAKAERISAKAASKMSLCFFTIFELPNEYLYFHIKITNKYIK